MAQILVIDDDANLLQMVKLMLQRVGHSVTTSSSGEEGLQLAAKAQPDMAIIDVMMPGLSGYDVVRKLREDPLTARIPIIILTARSQPMDKHMALEAGANAFLSKPVTSQELIERVEAVLKAGVNFRVHTGLLTEPVTQKSAPPPVEPAAESPAASSSPSRPRPLAKIAPIGADPAAEPAGQAARLPIISVASLRGGTGSTTLAVNLAFLLASRGRRVCLVDLSTSSGHIPLHLHLAPPQNWSHLLNMGDTPDPHAINQLLVQHRSTGVYLLAAPPVPSLQTLSNTAIQNVLTELGRNFNHVVVDVPNLDPAAVGALQVARSVVVVMADDPPSIQTTGQFLVALQNLGVEMGRVRVALNHIRPTRDVPAETIQKALKRPLSAEIPYEPNQFNAIRQGVPLVVADTGGAFAQSIQQLAWTMTT
jgi:pilus assembly protein CpaE